MKGIRRRTVADEFSVDQQRELGREVARLQARIHGIDLNAAAGAGFDLSFLPARDGDAIDRLLAEQRAYYDWARGELRLPVIERALEWLAARKPKNPGPTVINWGDARPGNVMFDGLTPTAVLDWEMVNLGPAGVDVGWLIFMHTFFQSLADVFQLPGFPEFCRRDDIVGAYVEAGENDNLIVQKLEMNPGTIGLFGYSYLEHNESRLKGLALDGVQPTYATIASFRYPGARPMYFYIKNAHLRAIPGIRAYAAEFVREGSFGPNGYLRPAGLIALNDAQRQRSARMATSMTPMTSAGLK